MQEGEQRRAHGAITDTYSSGMSLVRYVSAEEDSSRWEGFPFRQGDIVVSTRSKHGTTWMQAILLMLIHQNSRLPAPLGELSPWLDHLVEPRDVVLRRLEAQRHRRVIKTHTPLDGVPADPRAFYVVVARHPLDAAVSLYHQGDNIDRERLGNLTRAAAASPTPRPGIDQWVRAWIESSRDSHTDLDSLPGVMRHLADAWSKRSERNVILVHFDDLLTDLEGQVRRVSASLQLPVRPSVWPELLGAATFKSMRERAQTLVPDAAGVLRDPRAFFRRGVSGGGRKLLDEDALDRYYQRTAALAPPELLRWLHRGG